jgi:hypothetical protein
VGVQLSYYTIYRYIRFGAYLYGDIHREYSAYLDVHLGYAPYYFLF